jgi:aspartyl-tRNA synthetase
MHHPFTAPHIDDEPILKNLITYLQTQQSLHPTISYRSLPIPLSMISQLPNIRGQHYDLVCNGIELGGGSIRIHDSQLQSSILTLLGANLSTFQHLLQALTFGSPPHGGLAFGLDRVVGLLGAYMEQQNEVEDMKQNNQKDIIDSKRSSVRGFSLPIRDVIAFPKTTSGTDLMVGSPAILTDTQIETYHIKINNHNKINQSK